MMRNSSIGLDLMIENLTGMSVTSLEDDRFVLSNTFVFYVKNINASLMIIISLFGIFGNTASILVFFRLGFKDSINVSLCALAVSDLMVCVLSMAGAIGLNPFFQQLSPRIVLVEVLYSTINWPRYIFIKITKSLTALVTFERCLCVVIPMKIKLLITAKRVKILVVFIFVFVASIHIPAFYTSQLGWKSSPHRNDTHVFGLIDVKYRYDIDRTFHLVSVGFFSVFLFPVIVVCTVVLFKTLQQKADWRQKTTATGAAQTSKLSNKDRKVANMVAVISSIFIACSLPDTLLGFLILYGHDFTLYGKYSQLINIIFLFISVLTALNSAINILVYYFNGSRYREMFVAIFISKKE